MLNQAIAAEFFKASRRWSLLFWGFAFVPLCSFAIDCVLQLNPIKIVDFAPHVDLFSRMARAFEMSSSPLAEVFFIAAAAVIFGAEYDLEAWRLLVPRAPRTDLIAAKILLYAAGAFLSLILMILGACFSALLGAVRMSVPILWQATGISPGSAIALIFGLSWLELLLVGLTTGLIAPVSRSVLVPVVSLILAAFCQALMISMVNGHASIGMLAALPGLCAEISRQYVTHTEVSPGRYITAPEAVVAMLSLLAWILLGLSFTLLWFRRSSGASNHNETFTRRVPERAGRCGGEIQNCEDILMKALFIALCIVVGLRCEASQADVWQPSAGHVQVPIWPGAVPDAKPDPKPESVGPPDGREWWPRANDVSRPTMTVYAANGRNTGVAVVVFPGGGYQFLAMDLEGTEICDWLTSRGITCVLLKYRVPDSGPTMKNGHTYYPKVQTALQDAQRTLGLVRQHAAEWHVDPHKVGVIGFSAGGHLAAAVSTHFTQRTYPPVDAADELSCRPDFAIVLYPGHLWTPGTDLSLRPDIRVRADTPPTFLLHAEDDPVDDVKHSLTYYVALQKAGVPTEMHLYAQGGHAFGLRPTKLPIGRWPALVEQWLYTIGVLSPKEGG